MPQTNFWKVCNACLVGGGAHEDPEGEELAPWFTQRFEKGQWVVVGPDVNVAMVSNGEMGDGGDSL
eukprot:scaffold77452_cov42-Attheya_sp.AAC.2